MGGRVQGTTKPVGPVDRWPGTRKQAVKGSGVVPAAKTKKGTLASLSDAPPPLPRPPKFAPTLPTIRESVELAAQWATTSCACQAGSAESAEENTEDFEEEGSEIVASPSFPEAASAATAGNSTPVRPKGTNGGNVLAALQKYGSGKGNQNSRALISAGATDRLGYSSATSLAGQNFTGKVAATTVVNGANEASTLVEVVGSMKWSKTSAACGEDSSASSSASSSGASSPCISPRREHCTVASEMTCSG